MTFYQFLGIHSLLIGLLPFYLPVYLWDNGLNVAHITLLIGVSGLSFCASLLLWQRVSAQVPLPTLLGITFLLECVLICTVAIGGSTAAVIVLVGIANGLYNGFFWTTQRTLFLNMLGSNDTGRQYGNFQIFVTVFLKIGILLGGWLLELGGLIWLLGLSAMVSATSTVWFYHSNRNTGTLTTATLSLNSVLRFRDARRSRSVFIIDGFFLFLESHYWTLSLFALTNQNYTQLGLIVIVLALVFALIFYLIKNKIDSTSVSTVYLIAVCLYALSWLMRTWVSPELSSQLLLALLIVITFCSSFFRLAFNKRFFDIAQKSDGVNYLLVKSYWSQFFLGLGFGITGIFMIANNLTTINSVVTLYWVACVLSFGYLLYVPRK